MPPKLTAVLASLSIEASPSEFAEVESLLGGSLARLTDIRRNPVAKLNAVDLTDQEVSDRLSELPVDQDAELHVAWIADRLGARMSFEVFAANVDDIVCVLPSSTQFMVLVLDHEELITVSIVNPPG